MNDGCALVRHVLPARSRGAGAGVVVTLHEAGAPAPSTAACVGAACDVHALEGPRSRNALLSSGGGGPGEAQGYAGFAWFRRDASGRIDAAQFADSAWQVQCYLIEQRRALPEDSPLFLLGQGQGATLALAVAQAVAPALAGVVAVGGACHAALGPTLDGLPCLLIDAEPGTAELFRARGAQVETAPASAIESWLAARVPRPHIPQEATRWVQATASS